MKTLDQLYEEVLASEELKKEICSINEIDELGEFCKKHGCDATGNEIKRYFFARIGVDNKLDQLSGGKSFSLKECLFSIVSLGGGCLGLAIGSVIKGKIGTEIEGQGMLCAEGTDTVVGRDEL